MNKIKKKRILVRVDGNREIGLGHVYNMLTLLRHYNSAKFLVVMNSKRKLGAIKFKKFGYDVRFFSTQEQLFKIIKEFEPNIIFNDILNTNPKYIKKLKKFNCVIVNFEDLGKGRNHADLVFNPIYYSKKKFKNQYYGEKYACVREEFRKSARTRLRTIVKKAVITFGGTDPTDKTSQVLKIIHNSNLSKIEFNVILGLGYFYREKIKKIVYPMMLDGFKINIIEKSDTISKFIRDCDFAITSNGRTVFEIAAMKVPMISIAVNDRERTHSFVKYSKSGLHLNVPSNLDGGILLNRITQMMDLTTRKKFVESMEKTDILNGIDRVIRIINKKYEKFQ